MSHRSRWIITVRWGEQRMERCTHHSCWGYFLQCYIFLGMWRCTIGKESSGQTGRAKVKGRVSWATQLLFGAQWAAICPGAEEAKPGDKLPWQHVNAICCWRMYMNKLAWQQKAWDLWSLEAPHWADLICCGFISMTEHVKEEMSVQHDLCWPLKGCKGLLLLHL